MPILGTWSWPPDGPAHLALALAVLLAVLGAKRLGGGDPRRFLAASALAGALASLAYVAVYLRGGPRIIDATTYYLQARALAHGDLAWTIAEPSASFRGRFLLFHDGTLGGIFPPGYPLVLALGFVLGAPMIVGPLLAAGIVVATHGLARDVAEEHGWDAEVVARAAALLSIACAALRYHTADTMSHGAVALGVLLAFRAARRGRGVAAGLAIGWVLATRPVSAIPIGLVALALLPRRAMLHAALATLPGVALLLLSQHAVTGSFFSSTQRAYYAVSDGPPGCFRFGFGKGVGCLFEHRDFVKARLPDGYGLLAALGTTLRRLREHLRDVANLEPLALLVFVPMRRLRAAKALVALQIAAYVPFYFDGDYPGGGARFFADVLPVEHVLLVSAAYALAKARGLTALLGFALAGFAVHASFEHGKLRDRDGGRPMLEPDVLAKAGATYGLVFVDTDHGFGLGHDPHADLTHAPLVARLREDDRDRMLFERLGRPPTWRYHFDREKGPVVVPWAPPDFGASLRFEAEAEWPPLAQNAGYATPEWVDGCAGRALVLTPTGPRATATIALPVPEAGRYRVEVRIVNVGKSRAKIRIGAEEWAFTPGGTCTTLAPRTLALDPPSVPVTLEAEGGPLAIDRITIARE